jgi:hypothetical protein
MKDSKKGRYPVRVSARDPKLDPDPTGRYPDPA